MAPVPEIFQTPKLLQAFYASNEARLNEQGEALLKLVTLDQENSTPEELIYLVDDCISSDSQPFKAVTQILSTLLEEVFSKSDLADGAIIGTKGQSIHFMPLLDITTLEEFLKELHTTKPFGNFSLN